MNDLLAELERVRGLVAANDAASFPITEADQYLLREAKGAALELFRRPDFLALIEALREPVGYMVAQQIERAVSNRHGAILWNSGKLDKVRPGDCLYALPTKERDDG